METFQSFYYQKLKNHHSYDKIIQKSNQPAKLYAAANTRKFRNLDKITVEIIKFRPKVDQADTATYDTTRVIGENIKPLAYKNQQLPTLCRYA